MVISWDVPGVLELLPAKVYRISTEVTPALKRIIQHFIERIDKGRAVVLEMDCNSRKLQDRGENAINNP